MSEPTRPRPRPGIANWILAAVVGGFGILVFAWTVASGRSDSAMLFVGLPVLLAVALVLVPGRTTNGRVFQLTTVGLLLTAVAMHEGAICVILAAPLVYAVAHGTTALLRWGSGSRRYPVLLAPLLLLVSATEGSTEHLRVHPEQSVDIARVVALTPDEVARRLGQGPQPAPVRSIALRLLRVPVPHEVVGAGLAPGDRWMFHYPGSSHGPGGHIITQVSATGADRVEFSFVEDTAITARWFEWRHATITWRPVDTARTEVRLTISYRRGLDPTWYFGPLQQGLMHEGGAHLLDMLALS